MTENELETMIHLDELHYPFIHKPLIFGGLAMEYYGLRPHGGDVDLLISAEDYHQLNRQYPGNRKDIWGDFGLVLGNFELFRSIYRFDYPFYCRNAVELAHFKVVHIDTLFRMQVFAMEARPKNKQDVELIKAYYAREQNPEYKQYLNRHIDRYVNSPDGIFTHVQYDDSLDE
jgi:hypothetical protein